MSKLLVDEISDADNTGPVTVTDGLNVSSGNVGIGTSSPSSLLDVDQSQNAETNIELTNTNTGSSAQVRTKYTTDGGLFTVGKTSDAHAFGGDAYLYNVDNTNIRFATNDTERLRILSTGGITFNGDTAAANALDDYEEGTALVAMTASTSGSITLHASDNTFSYVKIGKQVTITGQVAVSSVSSPVGVLAITGLPFTNGGASYNAAGVALYSDALESGATTMMEGFIYIGHNYITVRAYAAGVTNGNSANLVKAGTTLRISATYFV